MKKLLAMLLALLMIFSLAACTSGQSTPAPENTSGETDDTAEEEWPQVTVTLGHCMTDDSIINDDALFIKDAVEKATNGTVTIDIYSGSVLGTEVAMFESMTQNSLDMMITPPSVIMNFVSGFGIYDIPYLIQDYDHARAVWKSPVGQELEKGLNDLGITNIAIVDFGYRQTTNNKRPIETPDDVKVLKMRTISSEVSIALWSQLGADAIAMPINEVFSALQTGVIDGQENPYTAIQTNGFYEVQKYCSETQHQYNMLNVMVTDDALSRMVPEQKEAFIEAVATVESVAKEMMDKRTEASVKLMEEAGMNFNKCDLDAFRAAAQPVIEQFAGVYGADKIQIIQDLAK